MEGRAKGPRGAAVPRAPRCGNPPETEMNREGFPMDWSSLGGREIETSSCLAWAPRGHPACR